MVKSRSQAKRLIEEGKISVNKKTVFAPAYEIKENDTIVLAEGERYVSRGGDKLESALNYFGVSPKDAVCLDVGASTGGFTDCLLKHGAGFVYAVDSGSGQMTPSLAADGRVRVSERFNARYMKKDDFDKEITFAVMDVSFISQTLIHEALYSVLQKGATVITLVKPQFELSKGALNKKGVVKSELLRKQALERVKDAARTCGFAILGEMASPVLGGDGNIEYLLWLRKEGTHEEDSFASESNEG